jgi:hypothetical protein
MNGFKSRKGFFNWVFYSFFWMIYLIIGVFIFFTFREPFAWLIGKINQICNLKIETIITFILMLYGSIGVIVFHKLEKLVFPQMYYTNGKNLGSGFMYNSKHKHIIGKIDIPPTIISYAYNKHFIVASQKPKEFNEAIYDKIEYIYPLGRDTVYYWLIVKQEQKVLGPLDYDSFLQLKKEYNVSDKLILKFGVSTIDP